MLVQVFGTSIALNSLIFVRSIRQGNFSVCNASICHLIKWVFLFNHVHYVRCLSVHLYNLITLENAFSDIQGEIAKGKSPFLKSNRQCSRIAINHVHEENQKIIKSICSGSHVLK